MYHKTRGLVLQYIKYSETSVVAKIYTEKLGLQSYMVKGVRAAKSKAKAAMLQPLTLLEMEVTQRENKQLQYIKEFQRAVVYQTIPFHAVKSTVAFFLLEVISKTVREHEPNAELFEFLYEALYTLDHEPQLNPDYHLIFMLLLSRYLGFEPHKNFSEQNCVFELSEGVFTGEKPGTYTLNKKESLFLHHLLCLHWFEPHTLKVSRAERQQMLKCLLKYYQLHVENFNLRSPEILEEILD